MTDENNNISCSASDIYYRILQLGSERIENGISLNELKKQLRNECLVSNPHNTEHIEQWFLWSFEHKEFGCKCPRLFNEDPCGCNKTDPCSQYDHDNDCNRFLSKDSIINFSQLEQSHKLNEQIRLNKKQTGLLKSQLIITEQNAQDAKKESSKAFKFAIGSILISLCSLIPSIISICDNTQEQIRYELHLQ